MIPALLCALTLAAQFIAGDKLTGVTGTIVTSVGLTIQEALYPGGTTGIARTGEPVTVGVPLPDTTDGATSVTQLTLSGATPGQFRVLGTWPSGRIKWVLVDTLADLSAGGTDTGTTLVTVTSGGGNFGGSNLATDGATISIATGAATFTVKKANFNGIDTAVVGATIVTATGTSDGFVLLGPDPTAVYPGDVTCSPTSGGTACTTTYASKHDAGSTCTIEENGPVRATLECTYDFEDGSGNVYMHGTARLSFYAGKSYVKVVSVLRNADDGTSSTFETAYKGIDGYELRTGVNITTASNTYTIANHTGTPTTGTLTGTDTAVLTQGISTAMQYIDNPTAYQITDSGYTITKNGSNVQTGTSAQAPQGWCDIQNASGVGIQVGIYQLAGSYPKGCGYSAAGQVARASILPSEGSTNYYLEWPQWNELTDVYLSFHASAPASLPNDFLKLQHALLGRTPLAYYNTTATFPTPLLDPTVEDTYTTTAWSEASPSISSGNAWAVANVTQAEDFGTVDANFPLQIVQSFSWNLETEYRYGYLLNFLTRGWTGRYLQAAHFYRHHLQYMLAHSDGFDWRTGHGAPGGATLDGFGHPDLTSGNSTLGTHGASEHNWRDQEHAFWYGMVHYYWLSGDEFVRDAMLDQQKDWFLISDTYQDGGSAGSSTLSTSGTAATKTAGDNWTAAHIGQVFLVGTSKTPYEVASVTDTTHLTFTTSAGTLTNEPFIVFNGLFNARSLATQFSGGVRFSDLLLATGDADADDVLTHLDNPFNEQVKAKGCASSYPAGCSAGTVGTPATWQAQGVHRERGFHWGSSGGSGNWCGLANTYRVNSLFQTALLAESLLEMRDYRGTAWADYWVAGDLALGITQWGKTEGWDENGDSQAVTGFRFGNAFDVRNDCQAAADVWVVDTSGTAVTRVSGPSFVTSGTWVSSYQQMYNGGFSFVVNGVEHEIASVTDGNNLVLSTTAGVQNDVAAYWREQNYDQANPNGTLTVWPHFFVEHAIWGTTDWEDKFKLSMQRSMAVNGTNFRDVVGHLLTRTIAALENTPVPSAHTTALTGFTDNGGGSYTIEWTVPIGAESYRVKWGTKEIVDWVGFNSDTNVFTGDPATTMNWFAATHVTAPAPATVCTTQSLTIATGTTGLTAPNFSVKTFGTSVADCTDEITVTWTLQTPNGTWPGYNGYHEPVYDPLSTQALFYITTAGAIGIYSTNIQAYAPGTNQWTNVGGTGHASADCTETFPPWPKDRHPIAQMAVDTTHNRLWLWGGVCQGNALTDMYYMTLNANPASNTWTQVTPATAPSVTTTGSMVYDPDTDVLVLFGGTSGLVPKTFLYCLDIELNGLSAAQTTAGCTVANDWKEISVTGGVYPLGVQFHRMHYDTVRDKVVLYGGSDSDENYNDIYEYTVSTKTWLLKSPAAKPPLYTGPGSPPTYAFVFIPEEGQFLYHQTYNTGAPRDWVYDPVAVTWTVVTSVGTGPTVDTMATYVVSGGKVVTYSQKSTGGTPDIWQATIIWP